MSKKLRQVIQQEIRMIKDQDGHADGAADDNIDQVDEEYRERPLHEDRLHEVIGIAGLEF